MDSARVAKSKATQEPPVKRMQSLYEVATRWGMANVHERSSMSGRACWGCWCWRSWQACRAWQEPVTGLPISKRGWREGLQLPWKRMPCANPSRYALARLDSQKVHTALAAWGVRKEARSAAAQRNRAG